MTRGAPPAGSDAGGPLKHTHAHTQKLCVLAPWAALCLVKVAHQSPPRCVPSKAASHQGHTSAVQGLLVCFGAGEALQTPAALMILRATFVTLEGPAWAFGPNSVVAGFGLGPEPSSHLGEDDPTRDLSLKGPRGASWGPNCFWQWALGGRVVPCGGAGLSHGGMGGRSSGDYATALCATCPSRCSSWR